MLLVGWLVLADCIHIYNQFLLRFVRMGFQGVENGSSKEVNKSLFAKMKMKKKLSYTFLCIADL